MAFLWSSAFCAAAQRQKAKSRVASEKRVRFCANIRIAITANSYQRSVVATNRTGDDMFICKVDAIRLIAIRAIHLREQSPKLLV